MFFLKLTRDKHKYELKTSLQKIMVSEAAEKMCQADSRILVKVKRGSHQFEVMSKPIENGQAKISKEKRREQIFNMTLFYSADDKSYLEKELQISCKAVDENDQTTHQFQPTILDIAKEIVSGYQGKFALEVGIDNNLLQLLFHFQLRRLDDDAKSESNDSNFTPLQPPPHHLGKNANKIPFQKPAPKLQNNSLKIPFSKPIPKSQGQINSPKQFEKKITPFASPFTTQNTQFNNFSNGKQINSPQQDKLSVANIKILQMNRKIQSVNQQNNTLKKENLNLQKTISFLVQQQNNKQQQIINGAISKQINQLKNTLIQQKLFISGLQLKNKQLKEQQMNNKKTMSEQKKLMQYLKKTLEKQKMKMGEMMQKCLEIGDQNMIQFLESFFIQTKNDTDQ